MTCDPREVCFDGATRSKCDSKTVYLDDCGAAVLVPKQGTYHHNTQPNLSIICPFKPPCKGSPNAIDDRSQLPELSARTRARLLLVPKLCLRIVGELANCSCESHSIACVNCVHISGVRALPYSIANHPLLQSHFPSLPFKWSCFSL